jgi:hypothetical protein
MAMWNTPSLITSGLYITGMPFPFPPNVPVFKHHGFWYIKIPYWIGNTHDQQDGLASKDPG